MYENALDCGISIDTFWGNSIAENLDLIESFGRNAKRRRKEQTFNCFMMANIVNERHPAAEKESLTMPWDYYPKLFEKEKEDFKKEKEASILENYKAAWKQRAQKFNEQRHGGGEKQ